MLAFDLGPSLAVDRSPRVGFDFSAGVLPTGASLTRASAGSRFDAAGVLRIEPADVARFDHDPASGASLGLLIEPERTNLLLRSAEITDAAWSGDGTRTANTDIAPDGTASADRYGYSGSGVFQSFACTADTDHVLSEYIKLGTVAEPDFLIAVYDETHLAFVAIDVRPDRALSTAGFARIDHAFRTPPGCTACRVYLIRNSALSAGDSAIFWGASVERGSGATSYIPTSGAAATRAADVLTLDWSRWGVADGPLGVRYVFDDGSSAEGEAEVANGRAIVPTALERRWLRRIERR